MKAGKSVASWVNVFSRAQGREGRADAIMILLISHPHFRPGGVRRVIELGAHAIARTSARPLQGILLAAGEAPDPAWLEQFRARVAGVPVDLVVERALAYVAEQRVSRPVLQDRLRRAFRALERRLARAHVVAWIHNPAVGRNALASRAWARRAGRPGWQVVFHHHDWWFDNRWARWRDLGRCGVTRPAMAARWMLGDSERLRHAAINGPDAAVLRRGFGGRAALLPNPAGDLTRPARREVEAARRWLQREAGVRGPVWLLPCRLLRRKNVAEALLLMRWIHPGACLVTTGAASSADEEPYARALSEAARAGRWPLRLSVLAGAGTSAPTVAALMGASAALLLSSLVEGFGLPFLEAVAARRPLVARRLPNVIPDLRGMGFRFPHLYDEVWIAPGLFDATAERRRQAQRFRAWTSGLPGEWRALAGTPWVLAEGALEAPVPMSRLTWAAQLEVLSHPPEASWEACRASNPSLQDWRVDARDGGPRLRVEAWPRDASERLGTLAYGRRFWRLVSGRGPARMPRDLPVRVQSQLARERLSSSHLYPLLWRAQP